MDARCDNFRNNTKQIVPKIFFTRSIAFAFSVVAFFPISLLLLAAATVTIWDISSVVQISLPSRCKIVSSKVDLKSSKICELGLLNFNAKNAVYPIKGKNFRCYFDYYWASVFEVEYKDIFSGETRSGLAETPEEALTFHCRPNFTDMWMLKEKFKVNESYECQYTSGISTIDMYLDIIHSCVSHNPSKQEMFRHIFTLLQKVEFQRLQVPAGLFFGFLASFVPVTIHRVLVQWGNLVHPFMGDDPGAWCKWVLLFLICFTIHSFQPLLS